jgi:hypothetical protein
MRFRPKSIFFTLALVLASQAFYANAQHSGGVTLEKSHTDSTQQPSEVGVPRSSEVDPQVQLSIGVGVAAGAAADIHTDFIVNPAGALFRRPAGSASFSHTQCPFIAESLTPEFLQLVRNGACLPDENNLSNYCACLGRLSAGSRDFKNTSEVQARNLRRVGYQFMLQQWANQYASQIMSYSALSNTSSKLEQSTAPSLPRSCDPATVYQNMQRDITDSTCGAASDQVSRSDFNRAIQAILGEELKEGTNFARLLEVNRNATRIYRYPASNPPVPSSQDHFVDCMPSEDKRAFSLLPITMDSAVAVNPLVRFDGGSFGRGLSQVNLIRDLNAWKISRRAGGSMSDQLVFGSQVMSAMEIFPGMMTLLELQSGSEFEATIDKLIGFIQHLSSEKYHGLAVRPVDQAKLQAALAEMSTQAQIVKSHVTEQLLAANASEKRTSGKIEEVCTELQTQLKDIACTKPDFIASPGFMQQAFRDAHLRGTRSFPGESPVPDYELCDVKSTPESHLGSCMTYHAAQCTAGVEGKDRWDDIMKAKDYSGGIMSPEFSTDIKEDVSSAYSTRRNESQMVHLMCADFNQYLRDEACVGKQGEAYRNCIVNENPKGAKYLAWLAANNLNSGIGKVLAQNNDTIGSQHRDRLLRFQNNVKNRSQNSAPDMLTASESSNPSAATIGATTLAAGNPSSLDGFRGVAGAGRSGPSGVNLPLDIDSPAEIQSEIRAKEQTVQANQATIASLNEQLGETSDDTELASLRSRIDELVAGNSQLNDDITALRRSMVEREAATREEALASASPESDEGAAAPSRRAVPGSGNGGVANIPEVQGGFNTGYRAPASTPETSSSGDFNKASVSTNFATAGATRGGPIQVARSLPASDARSEEVSRLSLRVGDASYPVSDVQSIALPREGNLSLSKPEDIAYVIGEQNKLEKIPVDAENRAFVEIVDPRTNSSIVVYVRINESGIEFLDANPPGNNDGVRATLLDLETRLREVVPQS